MWHKAPIPAGEFEPFMQGVRAAGYTFEQFEITARVDRPMEVGRIVSVGLSRTMRDFEAGSGQDWTGQAVDAVNHGVFGPP